MPIQETAGWQVIAKVMAPIVAVIGSSVWWLIRKWVDARFETVENRVSQNEEDIEDIRDNVGRLNTQVGEHGVHLEHIRENGDNAVKRIEKLHEKFDNHIAANGTGNKRGA